MKKYNNIGKIILGITTPIIAIVLIVLFIFLNYAVVYKKELSDDGLTLLNEYEFPWYLTEEDNTGNTCLRPYDVGDGVITFGPGITYDTEQLGISAINNEYNTDYTLEDNCINVEYLFDFQKIILKEYEVNVSKFSFKYNLHLSQNEFDALVILDYNSPNFLKDQDVIDMLSNEPTKSQYIDAINNYYQKLESYYDNQNTTEKNDGYGVGWYNRIVDTAEVYFDDEYLFQNNRVEYFNEIQ